jgi:hypothetical protein
MKMLPQPFSKCEATSTLRVSAGDVTCCMNTTDSMAALVRKLGMVIIIVAEHPQ